MATDKTKLSELSRPINVIKDTDLLLASKINSTENESLGVTFSALRSLLNFDDAFDTKEDGLRNTKQNELFYVFTDSSKILTNGFYNRLGIAEGIIDENNKLKEFPTPKYLTYLFNSQLTLRNDLLKATVYPFNLDKVAQSGNSFAAGVNCLRTAFGIIEAWTKDFIGLAHTIVSLPTTTNGFGGYDIVTDKGTFEFVTPEVKALRDNNNVLGWGVDVTGATLNDAHLQKIATATKTLNLRSDQKMRVSTIPTTFTAFTGGGRLIWDNNAGALVVYTMPDYFNISNFSIETIYRNRLAFKANYLNLSNVKEYQSDVRTDQARFNAVEWQSDTLITCHQHATFNTGARFIATGADCALDVNGIVCHVNHVGEGPDGNNHGCDGIKVSGGMRSLTVNNYKCFGTSRDIIDTFIGGGECNLSNIWADGYYFNQIEIKTEGTAAADSDGTVHDINISNVVCRSGGNGVSDTFAAIMIYNQSEGDDTKSPRRVNVTNYNSRGIGLTAGAQYYGLRVVGGFDVNLTNVNLTQVKTHGANLTRCRNVKLVNSNLHGVARGVSIGDCTRVAMIGCTIGKDEQSGDESPSGLVLSGTNSEIVTEASFVYGTNRSLSIESATINKGKFVSTNFNGPVRIDLFTDLEFIGSSIDARSATTGTIDCFLSSTATPAAGLKFIGGRLMNARRGINEQSLTYYRCIGVTFENLASPMGTTGADSKRIIIGCVSVGAGAFPTATATDQISGNIVVS